ncbi:hypothetical protein [Geminisphaera colitermitum]|uniref:hypothetical protein n=1 Tax=Geminisphaera colitermitum TaxID=1148786 RepID=UPI000158C722|nr:hypothetical protein [Geminisphaera colitermitum]
MINAARTPGEPKRWGKGSLRFPGIVADARTLGVTYSHLYRVLTGDRKSPLLARYQALKEGRS